MVAQIAADVSGEILGVAGGRVCALRSKEARPFELEELRAAFPEITRS